VESFDYVIVGAGTAAACSPIAFRRTSPRVLVLEAGGSDDRFWIKAPIGYGFTFADPSVNWKYQTAASPDSMAQHVLARGRVVGGSSSINALVYCRGMPADFDDWRALGNAGWAGRTFDLLRTIRAPRGPTDVRAATDRSM